MIGQRFKLTAKWQDAQQTVGVLTDHRDSFVAFTLEPGRGSNPGPVIPGFYALERHGWNDEPVKFKQTWALSGTICVHHEGSPGYRPHFRTGIVFHAGNTVDDTEGCILVGLQLGYSDGGVCLIDSQKAMDRVRKKIGLAEATLHISR